MIRTAVIGAGIGAKHLEAYRSFPNWFEIAAICDIDADRARGCLRPGESIAVTDRFDDILSDQSIDLVNICLPPHLHLSMSKAALAAGKHVICEKPLVGSLAEMDDLIHAVQVSGKQLFPVFQYRYGPGTARLQALIDAGLAGEPLVATVQTHWNRGADYYAVDWRGTWAGEGGGCVLSHAIHNHDLVSRFMGPIQTVHAMLDTRVNPIEVDDCAALAMRTQKGALITSSITLGGAKDMSRLRFVFSELTAETGTEPYAPASGDWQFTARNPDNQARVDAIVAQSGNAHLRFDGFFEAVYHALTGQAGHEVTIEDGRRSIELVTAIYQSNRTGMPVTLPLGTDCELYHGWLPEGD